MVKEIKFIVQGIKVMVKVILQVIKAIKAINVTGKLKGQIQGL